MYEFFIYAHQNETPEAFAVLSQLKEERGAASKKLRNVLRNTSLERIEEFIEQTGSSKRQRGEKGASVSLKLNIDPVKMPELVKKADMLKRAKNAQMVFRAMLCGELGEVDDQNHGYTAAVKITPEQHRIIEQIKQDQVLPRKNKDRALLLSLITQINKPTE